MNLFSWSKSASVAVLVFTSIACSSEPIEPGHLIATYAATSVGGNAIPHSVIVEGGQRTLLADTLRLWSGGLATHTQIAQFPRSYGSTEYTVLNGESRFDYKIDGTRLTFFIKCGPNELCAEPPVGTIGPSGVTLSYSILGQSAGELILKPVQ